MSETMTYRDFIARIRYSSEDESLIGEVVNVRDSIHFHGDSITEIEQAFHDAIDAYIEACEAAGQEPARPVSGNFRLRLTPETHRMAVDAAAIRGKSLNTYVVELVTRDAAAVTGSAVDVVLNPSRDSAYTKITGKDGKTRETRRA